MSPPDPNNRLAMIYGLAAVACWSTVATAFKLALSSVDTYQLVFYSTLTASVFLLTVVAVRGQLAEIVTTFTSAWKLTLIAGVLNPVVYYIILFHAYDLLPAQVAMSINYSWAIVLTLMSIVFLHQKILIADIVAAFVCYAGVIVIATEGSFSAFSLAQPLGLMLALASTVIWAAYWTINVKDQRDPVVGLCLNFLIALPLTLLVLVVMSDFAISLKGLAGSVYVGLVEMGIAFLFWSAALNLTNNTARVSNLIFLSPFVSLIIINQVLGEEIYITTLAGLVLIIGGLLYQQAMHRRSSSAIGR